MFFVRCVFLFPLRHVGDDPSKDRAGQTPAKAGPQFLHHWYESTIGVNDTGHHSNPAQAAARLQRPKADNQKPTSNRAAQAEDGNRSDRSILKRGLQPKV